MSKAIFNTGERRGMIVVIAILSIIIAISLIIKSHTATHSNPQQHQTDSIAKVLRSQVEAQKTTSENRNKKEKKERQKKKEKKDSNKKKSKKNKKETTPKGRNTASHVERDPLSETLPSDN